MYVHLLTGQKLWYRVLTVIDFGVIPFVSSLEVRVRPPSKQLKKKRRKHHYKYGSTLDALGDLQCTVQRTYGVGQLQSTQS